jgi:hypothetical protein
VIIDAIHFTRVGRDHVRVVVYARVPQRDRLRAHRTGGACRAGRQQKSAAARAMRVLLAFAALSITSAHASPAGRRCLPITKRGSSALPR